MVFVYAARLRDGNTLGILFVVSIYLSLFSHPGQHHATLLLYNWFV
jgi:hypothetical protein